MRKFFFEFLLLVCSVSLVFGICMSSSARLIDLFPGDTITGFENNSGARIAFPQDIRTNDLQASFLLGKSFQPGSLHILITDISSFSLYVNDELCYSFQGQPSIKRLHDIPINSALTEGDTLEIRIAGEHLSNTVRCLLGDGKDIAKSVHIAQTMTAVLLGMYLAIIFNCLSMYFRKKTETYLLYMALFTFAAACTCLLYSTYEIPDFSIRGILHQGYLNAVSKVLCLVLCMKLMKISPFPKAEDQYPLYAVIIAIVMVFILNAISSTLRKMCLDLIAYATIVVAVYARYKSREYSRPMLFGTSISFAFMFYASFVNYGWIKPGIIMYYVHMAGFYYIGFDFICLYIVNSVFAQKYVEADRLIKVVEASNRELDEKVRLRTVELEAANANLLRNQEEKRVMMTNLFHDLRNPLFCAAGYAEILESEHPESKQITTVLHRQLDYISHLVENLFLISKLEDKQITFNKQAVDFSNLCSVIVEDNLPEAKKQNDTVTSEISPQLYVTGDGYRLKQAITNIFINAIQHNPENTHICLKAFRKNDHIILEITDDGRGISSESLTHLFDRYYTKSSNKGGSGLGLNISKEIISAHDGQIEVISGDTKGTCFTVTLPFRGNENN